MPVKLNKGNEALSFAEDTVLTQSVPKAAMMTVITCQETLTMLRLTFPAKQSRNPLQLLS